MNLLGKSNINQYKILRISQALKGLHSVHKGIFHKKKNIRLENGLNGFRNTTIM